jgi:trans-aconitate 2-methyltransferase
MTIENSKTAASRGTGSADWNAATYDRIADPMARWGTAVLERLCLEGHERVLDAGCGTGRVTEDLCKRLPHGTVIALDLSSAMLAQARRRLAPYEDRVRFLQARLGRPLPLARMDAVFSTATFHWIHDHDVLFGSLAAVLRPGGQLVAQCGGAGNIERVHAAARAAGVDLDPTHFATPTETARRLDAAGFVEVRCWLQPEPTRLAPGEAFETYLRTVCLRRHLEQLPVRDHGSFLQEVMRRLGEPLIDYVRLNLLARRQSEPECVHGVPPAVFRPPRN